MAYAYTAGLTPPICVDRRDDHKCIDHTGDCCADFPSFGMYLIASQNTVGQIAHLIAFALLAQPITVVGMAQLIAVSLFAHLIAQLIAFAVIA